MTRAIKARPFDFPYDGKLDSLRTALLVIDMQQDFLSNDGYFARPKTPSDVVNGILALTNGTMAGPPSWRTSSAPSAWLRRDRKERQPDGK
jgi:nicotinamidase-related amidase